MKAIIKLIAHIRTAGEIPVYSQARIRFGNSEKLKKQINGRNCLVRTLGALSVSLIVSLISPAQAGTFEAVAKLTASDAAAIDLFGHSVAVDANTAIVGAFRDDDNGSESGSAYVFTRVGGVRSEQAKLTASDGAPNDFFGLSVAVDGNTAVVGAAFNYACGQGEQQ